MGKITMTEDQAEELCNVLWLDYELPYSAAMNRLKQAGYIKQNTVEEAEDMYAEFFQCHSTSTYNLTLANEAIEELNK